MGISEWDDFVIDEPVMYIDHDEPGVWKKGHFAGKINAWTTSRADNKPCVYGEGTTKWSHVFSVQVEQCRRPTPDELNE